MSRHFLTREQFDALRSASAAAMSADADLQHKATDLVVHADRYRWFHQLNWFGEPVLQLPHDMFAVQEIVFRAQPKFIVELGVAWGGSVLFSATLLTALGGERVIGVDVTIPEHVATRLRSFDRISRLITLIEGSSCDDTVVEQVRSIVGASREVLVILDSFHTHEHVLRELRLYSPLVGAGHYIICCDTHVEHMPQIVANRPRPWGKGNNPKTAVDAFLQEDNRFEADRDVDRRLLLTLHPGGYLRCRKD